jgi:hypothetical protein
MPRLRLTSPLCAAIAVCISCVSLAGCGGSSSTSSKLSVRVVPNPNTVTGTKTTGKKGAPTTAPHTPNPCLLVTAPEAATILKAKSVKSTEAPLGPTCILSATAPKENVTLSIQVIDLTREVHEMKHMTQTTISGHKAYCGVLGTSVLLVPVLHQEVLDISAPCTQAEALAAKALTRVAG